jgi:hypothetical protein
VLPYWLSRVPRRTRTCILREDVCCLEIHVSKSHLSPAGNCSLRPLSITVPNFRLSANEKLLWSGFPRRIDFCVTRSCPIAIPVRSVEIFATLWYKALRFVCMGWAVLLLYETRLCRDKLVYFTIGQDTFPEQSESTFCCSIQPVWNNFFLSNAWI